ncbi:hypothetical protein FRC03_001635 [Tulasnella sp. 419]|nr:hypothetical protein FRC03_001635 [Tulasnella sp. 419]
MASHAVITGAPKVVDPNNPGIGPQPQPRLNIYDFVRNEKHFSLYVQALNRMYAMDQDDDPSQFALGGIHGLPYRPWASADEQPNPDTQWGGYCTHGTVLFPTWHRPYVAGYEQFIQQNALIIAQSYNDPTWVDAAQRLRAPYWDWAAQGQAVPPDEIINMPQVTITTPSGRQSVTNPFWGYTFHPIDPSFGAPFSGWRKTLRRPASNSPNAKDDPVALKNVLNRRAFTTTKNTYKLFSIRNWDLFSNHTASSGSGTNSLESVHDDIHDSVGGRGHMGDPRYAGELCVFS